MKEMFKNPAEKIMNKVIVDTVMPAMRDAYREGGFSKMGEKSFEILHARPSYLHEVDPDFTVDRMRLNSEPGLIISNHPGPGDCPAILETLKREDVKLVVAEEAIKGEKLDMVLPDQMLLGATKDMGGLRMLLKKVVEHIRRGGAVFYFPTGLVKEGEEEKFASLFGALIKEIPPESMLYAFHINPSDVKKVTKKTTFVARSSADFFLPEFLKPVTKIGDPSLIRVNEQYTQVSEWLESFKQSGKSRLEMNQAMTEYYMSLFPEDTQE